MQPEQRDEPQPSQSTQVDPAPSLPPQSPYLTPDYLGLTPVAPKKSKKPIFLIVTGTLILVILGGLGGLAFIGSTKSDTPQSRLYPALEKLMAMSYIQKDSVYKFEDKTTTTKSTIDASNPFDIKSLTEYTLTKKSGNNTSSEVSARIYQSGKNIYRNVTSASGSYKDISKQYINSWIKWYNPDQASKTTVDLRDFNLDTLVYSSLIPPFTGEYSPGVVSSLINEMKSKKVFEVSGLQDKIIGGNKLQGVTILITSSTIDTLNTLIKEKLGFTGDFAITLPSLGAGYNDMVVWIDKDNNVRGVDYNSGYSRDDILSTVNTIFKQLEKATINDPTK